MSKQLPPKPVYVAIKEQKTKAGVLHDTLGVYLQSSEAWTACAKDAIFHVTYSFDGQLSHSDSKLPDGSNFFSMMVQADKESLNDVTVCMNVAKLFQLVDLHVSYHLERHELRGLECHWTHADKAAKDPSLQRYYARKDAYEGAYLTKHKKKRKHSIHAEAKSDAKEAE